MKSAYLEKTLKIVSTNDDFNDEIEIINKIEEGFSFEVIEELITENKFSLQEIIELVLPNRTYYRRKKEMRLNSEESDIVANLFNLTEFAEEVFGDKEKAYNWLRRINRSLKSRKPIALLKTAFGRKIVEDVLSRIAYGVY
ncbi:MAG: antitoxin Xre/MbcA/ParS toxin-binding domain-containing protein [bacterium]